MSERLSGCVALVTGSSRGIGFAIADRLVAEGASVILAATRADLAERAATGIRSRYPEAYLLPRAWDVRDHATGIALFGEIAHTFGRLDVLVCNAAVFHGGEIASMRLSDFDDLVAVNLRGSFIAAQLASALLKKSSRSRAIFISSVTGYLTGEMGMGAYAATKSAQVGLMRTMALELAACGGTANAILPGNIATDAINAKGADAVAAIASAIPVGRLGEPAEVAALTAFLASSEAGFITGQTIVLDGGQTIPELRLGSP